MVPSLEKGDAKFPKGFRERLVGFPFPEIQGFSFTRRACAKFPIRLRIEIVLTVGEIPQEIGPTHRDFTFCKVPDNPEVRVQRLGFLGDPVHRESLCKVPDKAAVRNSWFVFRLIFGFSLVKELSAKFPITLKSEFNGWVIEGDPVHRESLCKVPDKAAD
jgi:hypothetical protein